jgi:hypothetical protein
MIPIEIVAFDGIKFGCVPTNLRKINGLCTYSLPSFGSGPGTFSCPCSPTYPYPVTMMTGSGSNNPNAIATGCAQHTSAQVPCLNWRIINSVPDLEIASSDADKDGWTI